MTSKTIHQIPLQKTTSQVSARLASASSTLAHLGPVSRGAIMLLVLLLVAIPSVAVLFPRRVTPASAASDVFSAERAMAHLEVIAQGPHPQGSPAQRRVRDYLAGQLRDMGLEVEIQQTAGLENVVARLHGSDPTGAIVILAHYDTVSYSSGAGDNSSACAALLEIMRALSAGPAPLNDVIVLFDDGEEYPDIFAGTKAFVREHPWMSDVRVAVSIDTAVAGFISTNEVGPQNNGWLVHALARAYTGGAWMSFSGGGEYNSTPFRDAGILVLALEDNYPFKEKHTADDLPGIIKPASVQQLGEQTLSIARVLGSLDLADPWGEQETFFFLPLFGFIHYPQAWAPSLAIAAAILLLLALGLALRRRLVSWKGLAVAFGVILASAALSAAIVSLVNPRLPGLFRWPIELWPDWPEVIPPNGWTIVSALGLLVLAVTVGGYLLARRWSGRIDLAMAGLVPFSIPAVALAFAEPRTAYAFTWPILVGSLVWIAASISSRKLTPWTSDLAAVLAAVPLTMMLLPFPPGIVMSDGMKSLAILAAVEAALLGVMLPAVDGLLVRFHLKGFGV